MLLHARALVRVTLAFALSAFSAPLAAQTCIPPPPGMVAWIPGDGNPNDIASGGVGTTQGNLTYASGKVGQALHFDGATAMLTFPQRPALDVGEQVTIDFWMQADLDNPMNVQGLVTTDFYGVEIGGGLTPVIGAEFYVSTDGGSFHHSTDGSSGSPLITPGVWYHYAGVYDGTSLSLYENGVLVRQAFHSGVIAPMLPTSFLSIGSEDGLAFDPNPPDRKNRFFKGLIDEVHIFDRALSVVEIQDIHAAESAGACKPDAGPVTSVSIWVGLANSDDVGIRFDLRAEVYKNSTELIGAGEVASVSGGSSGFNNAHPFTIDLTPVPGVTFVPGDTVSIALFVRNACTGSGKNSGRARLWYDDAAANSRFMATIGSASTYYLRSNFVFDDTAGAGPKKTINVQAGPKCSPYKTFGAWSGAVPF
jgi:hypothetical protein